MTVSEEELLGLFRSIGDDYGYDEVQTKYTPFKEFKSRWTRSGRNVDFQISDYLREADPSVMQDYGHALFNRIVRRNGRDLYSDHMRKWLASPEFVQRNQPIYIQRSRNLSVSPLGRTYDLKDAYWSLREEGLINDSQDAVISWTVNGNRYRVGYCSVLMKVIAISSALDNPAIPDYVHRYVLYHELLHLEKGLTTTSRHHTSGFRAEERMFSRWREAEGWLKKLAAGGC